MEPMKQGPIEIVAHTDALARLAMGLFLDQAEHGIEERGIFRVAVSGGRTPQRFFECLADSSRGQALDWQQVQLFWSDERFVPVDDPQSNYRMTHAALLTRVPVPPENVFRITTEHETACQAAIAYERTLRQVFVLEEGQVPVFDLLFLGIGADGHTASLFPGTYAPFNREDWVCGVTGAPGGLQRISLTAPVLCAAREIAVVAAGRDKADILRQVLEGNFDASVTPIHVLEPVWHRVRWLMDQDAASLLSV